MESNLDKLALQARNNINILSVEPLSRKNSEDGMTTMVAVSYEFQYRPVPGASPHWVKTCDIILYKDLRDEDSLRDIVIKKVRAARAAIEGGKR